MRFPSIAIGVALACVLVACGFRAPPSPGSRQTSPSAEPEACVAQRSAAADVIAAVIAANQSCKEDGDCAPVAQGGCIDACSRVMATSGASAYEKASAEIQAKYCAPFRADRCPMPPSPPCAPGPPPTCTAGHCR